MIEKTYPFIPYDFDEMSAEDTSRHAADFLKMMIARRSLRHFTDRMVAKSVIEDIIMTAPPTTQDAQAFDKTRIANETQSFSHTDEPLDLNELEQVFCWYYHLHHRLLIVSPNKDKAPNHVTDLGENDEMT